LIFPEGTRSRDGEIQPFKDGAFRLAIEKNCPVIPLVLDGTGRTLPPRGWHIDRSADCSLSVLPAIDPAEFNGDLVALREHVRAEMIAAKHARASSPPARIERAPKVVGS
jgi:1-acyl-sn-glycerol-3-phosphate acyltransferase